MSRLLQQHGYLLRALLLQLLMLLLVNAKGHFPINDDWAYAHSVLWLLQDGHIRLSNWIAMNLLPQTLLGAAVSSVFGYSLQTLRALTQVLSLGLVVLVFIWFERHLMASYQPTRLQAKQGAFWLTLAFIGLPWWLPLSNSYMTEVPCLLLLLAALLQMRRLLLTEGKLAWQGVVLAAVLITIATLQRQTALAFAAAFLFTFLLTAKRHRLSTLCLAALPLLMAAVAHKVYLLYLTAGPGVPIAQLGTYSRLLWILDEVINNKSGLRYWPVYLTLTWIISLAAYSLFALPAWAPTRRRSQLILGLLGVLLTVLVLQQNWVLPFRANHVLGREGIGPMTYFGKFASLDAAHASSATAFWVGLSIAAVLCLTALLWRLLGALHNTMAGRFQLANDRYSLFLCLAVVAYSVPFCILDYFDRYVYFLLPLLWALFIQLRLLPVKLPTASQALIVAILLASTVLAHDYFAWQKARSRAIEAALARGATAANLDGGFEFNGYHAHETFTAPKGAGKSWWWVTDDRYRVMPTVSPGYTPLARFKVHAWVQREPAEFILSERQESPP
jgi:hypothetical protein